MGKLNLDDLNWRSRPYAGGRAYADSKLANLMFTLELDRQLRSRLTRQGSSSAPRARRDTDLGRPGRQETGIVGSPAARSRPRPRAGRPPGALCHHRGTAGWHLHRAGAPVPHARRRPGDQGLRCREEHDPSGRPMVSLRRPDPDGSNTMTAGGLHQCTTFAPVLLRLREQR